MVRSTSTLTTTITVCPTAKVDKRPNATAALLSSFSRLLSNAPSIVSTVCSCIETTPSVKIVTSTVSTYSSYHYTATMITPPASTITVSAKKGATVTTTLLLTSTPYVTITRRVTTSSSVSSCASASPSSGSLLNSLAQASTASSPTATVTSTTADAAVAAVSASGSSSSVAAVCTPFPNMCGQHFNPYPTRNGVEMVGYCDQAYSADESYVVTADSLEQCVYFCQLTSNCDGVTYHCDRPTSNCVEWFNVDLSLVVPRDGAQSAFKTTVVEGAPYVGACVLPPNPMQYNGTALPTICDNIFTPDGFVAHCGYLFWGPGRTFTHADTLDQCLSDCRADATCVGAAWDCRDFVQSNCIRYSDMSDCSNLNGFQWGITFAKDGICNDPSAIPTPSAIASS